MLFHIAEFNIARMRAPLQDPLMAGFGCAACRHQQCPG